VKEEYLRVLTESHPGLTPKVHARASFLLSNLRGFVLAVSSARPELSPASVT
jgi:hypothetical protein